MTDLNKVIVIGRITKDLDESNFGFTSAGKARANVSIAVNRSRKVEDRWTDEVSYFDVTIWGKVAENLRPYLTKGRQIAVDGYLKQDRWEKDGKKNSRVVIVAESVQMVGGKAESGTSPSESTGTYNNNSNASMYEVEADETIPF